MSEKTTYTEIWEKDFIEGLYERFCIAVQPFETPLNELVVIKSKEIFKSREDLTVFEIGAGSGKSTLPILNGLAQKFNITYSGIDVSNKQKKLFEEITDKFSENINLKDYSISSWQEYAVVSCYDIVLAQHSWYGIGGDLENFNKIKEILNSDGVCFIIINSNNNISHIAMQTNGENPYCSEDLEVAVVKSGLTFEKIRTTNNAFTRETFCKDGKLTQRGLDHFSYLYRKDLRGDEQDVIDMINNSPDEAFRFPTDLVIVRK